VTFLPDHRATHPPSEQCDGCRLPALTPASPAGQDRRPASHAEHIRPDLVLRPGANRE
jgi:hypothetical protein